MLKSRYVERDRVAGGLLGLLIGSAVGVPYQGREPRTLPSREAIDLAPPAWFERAHPDVPPGFWSASGAQALCLLESLLEIGGFEAEDFVSRLSCWFAEGHLAVEGAVFHVDEQTRRALKAIRWHVPRNVIGPSSERDNSAGALARALPLALWHRDDDASLMALAMDQSLPTHGHLRSQLCCAFYCLWARKLLDGSGGWSAALATMSEEVTRWPECADEWARVLQDMQAPQRETRDVVDMLVWARSALESGSSFADVVRAAITLGYDTDITAAVAGGLAGILYGSFGIPREWREGLCGAELYAPLLSRLLEAVSPHVVADGGAARTSQSHPLRIGTLDLANHPGRIGITFCPGKRQDSAITGRWARDLDADLAAICAWGARHLVTLVEQRELSSLGVEALPERAHAHGLIWHHLPIVDGMTPDRGFDEVWPSKLLTLRSALLAGDGVVVHCKGGVGRAGTVAARLLLEIGEACSSDEAIQRVREVRNGAVETVCQEHYLAALAASPQPACELLRCISLAPLGDLSGEDLAVGALYIGLQDGEGWVRVFDRSGEDYVYPMACFEAVRREGGG